MHNLADLGLAEIDLLEEQEDSNPMLSLFSAVNFSGTSRYILDTNTNCLLHCGCIRHIANVHIKFRACPKNPLSLVHHKWPPLQHVPFSQHNPLYVKFTVQTWHSVDPNSFPCSFQMKYGICFHVL